MKELKWTKTKPKKEGWYWNVTYMGDIRTLTIIQVINSYGTMIGFISSASGVSIDMINGKWAGPLIPPVWVQKKGK